MRNMVKAFVAVVMFASVLALTACPPPVVPEVRTDYSVTLPAAVYTAITNQLETAGAIVDINETDASDWGLIAGTKIYGVAVVADATSVYFALVPAMMQTNTNALTNRLAKATWVPGWPMEAVNGASKSINAGWWSSYVPFIIGEPGVDGNANQIGGFYGRRAIQLGLATQKVGSDDLYVVKIDKVTLKNDDERWGFANSIEFKFGFVAKADTADTADTSTKSYVFIPFKNLQAAEADIPEWGTTASFILLSTSPAEGGKILPTDKISVKALGGINASMISGGNLVSGVTFILSGDAVLTNNGGNVPAALNGDSIEFDLSAVLNFGQSYTLTINGLVDASGNTNTTAIVINFASDTLTSVTYWYTGIQKATVNYDGAAALLSPEWYGTWALAVGAPQIITLVGGFYSNSVSIPSSYVANITNHDGTGNFNTQLSFKADEVGGAWWSDRADNLGDGHTTPKAGFTSFNTTTQGIKIDGSTGTVSLYTK